MVAGLIAVALLADVVPLVYFAVSGGAGAPAVPKAQAVHGVHTVKPRKPVKRRNDAARRYRPGTVTWPAARSGSASLTAGHTAKISGTPVWARPLPSAHATAGGRSSLTVKVAGHRAAADAGVTGMLFTATPGGAVGAGGSQVRIGVDYRAFARAYGGDFGSRLRLVSLPACALTSPQAPGCRTQTPLPDGANDARSGNVYATLSPATSGPTVLAATSGSGGDGGGSAGTYSATDLKASGTWSAGGSSGSFTYTYPISAPPAPSSLVPALDLSYDSGSVDGQTAATQAQAGWAGDGWSTPRSYIEQSFVACSDSPEGSAAPQSTPDECYDGPILTLSLNGTSTALVWDASKKTFKPADDNGDVVTHITGSGNGSGTYNTDYWQVTDRSGTVYLFGRNHLPGWASGKAATDSVDSEPVFSAHSGDPCYDSSGFSSSVCTMAYRWNLDYVKDLHGNAMAYYYKQDTNAYAENGKTASAVAYVRDSHLDHIDYGFTDGHAYDVNGGHAPDQVVFTTGDRCLSGTCDPLNSTNAKNWPDVPYDLNCGAGASCQYTGPSFWSTVRLTGIKTQQWNGSAYAPVDSWALTETLPATGDGTAPTLWLSSITHTGSDTTAGGAAVTLPPVSFTATMLQNRVATHDGLPILTRDRIGSITTETGEVIGVNYEQVAPCSWPVSVSPSSNTSSCYPVYWTPAGYSQQIEDWFNKWEVASVTQADPTGGNPTMYTSYKYLGGAAWHYDDNEVVKAKYRTYGQWRGFGDVQTFTGQGSDAPTESEATYYRGMSKDNDSTAVTLTDSQGGQHDDTDQLAGDTLESTDYNYAGGPVTGSTITSYWVSPPTASRSRDGLPALTANSSGPVETWARTAITSNQPPTWRKTETDTSYDTDPASPTFGLQRVVFAHGDLADPSQQRCTVTTYAPANTGANLVGLPAEVEADADACGGDNPGGASAPSSSQTNALTAPTSVTRPDDVVADQRTFYDEPSLAATWPQPASVSWPQPAPTKGDGSEVQVASGYSGGAFTYQVQSATVYDSYGRPTDTYDPLGHKSHIDYTMTNGLTTGTKTTNPLGQAATQTVDPLRGLTTAATDPNGVTTTRHYDGLGRTTAVWGYDRATTEPANATFGYQVSSDAPSTVTTQTMNDAKGYVTSTTLYDALLRTRQTQQPTPEGGRLVTDTFYDTRGWAWKKNTDWWDSGATPGTGLVTVPDAQVRDQDVIDFDGAGRPVLDVSYDQSNVKAQTAKAYEGDRTITVPLDASGRPFTGGTATATLTDALGRTTELDSYTTSPAVAVSAQGDPSITTVSITGGASQATRYTFDKVGHQTDVKDVSSGEDWNFGYNLLGQVTTKKDPDAGTSTMKYDAAGNPVETTDARGKTISLAYDALNRKTGEFDAPVSAQSPADQLSSWVYDNSNNAVSGMTDPIGHVTTATSYAGGNAYTTQERGFNAYGESAGETITIPAAEGALAGSYTFTHLYTSGLGLPGRDTYPASPGGGSLPAETVTHGYSGAMDFPVSLGGLSAYAANVTATPFGQVAQEEMGSNAADHGYITNTYDMHAGTLTDSQVTNTAVSSTPIDDTTYTYDPAGNPLSQTENRQGTNAETQCYKYDGLDRLTQAWTATDSCAADPASGNGTTVGSGIPGSAYWTTWKLDPLGQRTEQVDHGLNGAMDTVTKYAYNTAQPNTLASTSTSGPGVTSATSYGYDAAGDTSTRTTPAQGQQTLTWSDDGQLTAVTSASGGSSYIYDADGDLLLRKDPGTTTLYLPNEEIALNTTTGAITGTRFYPLPGGGEAIRTGSGSAYSFETGDRHGTATLALDATLSKPVWRQQTAYGEPRGTAPSIWPDDHGFLDQPQDGSTGLTQIGARWYDPAIGRFTSLDPVFEPASPQEQNGYTYAAANPVTGSDPSGLYTCRNGNEGCDEHGNPPCSDGNCNGDTQPGDCVHTECGNGRDQNYEDPFRGSDGYAHSNVQYSGNDASAAARRAAEARRREFERKLRAAVVRQLEKELRTMPDYEQNGEAYVPLDCSFADGGGCVGGYPDKLLNLITSYFGLDKVNECVNGKYAQCLPALIAVASSLDRGGRAGKVCNSFAGGTQVPMADGTTERIDEIKVGDKIANAVPGADRGTSDQAHTVTAVHVTHTDRDYTDVTIATPAGPRTVTGTSHHLYWDATTRAWTPADHLRAGDHLQARGGKQAVIVSVHTHTAAVVTYNLTVDGLHTYYVDAGVTSILVHNGPANCGREARALWKLTREGSSAVKRGGPFNTTFYKSASDGTWWTPDVAGHGESAFKVYEETSKGLQWIADADKWGTYISGKWKGNTGYFVPWSNLRGVR